MNGIQLYRHQVEAVDWMESMENSLGGGILADEMGVGKTFEILGLIIRRRGSGPTLVVVPASLVSMWIGSIRDLCGSSLRYTVMICLSRDDLSTFDIVLITYSHLISMYHVYAVSEDGLTEPAPVKGSPYHFMWSRVVLEEGHRIRSLTSTHFKAVLELESDCRWVVTGTPVQNSLKDLHPYFAFLRFRPLGTWHCRERECDCIRFEKVERVCRSCGCPGRCHVSKFDILLNFLNGRNPELRARAAAHMAEVRAQMMYRRRLRGITTLPQREDIDIYVEMDEDDRIVYDVLLRDIRDKLDYRNYRHILDRLSLMRQMCDDRLLVRFSPDGEIRDLPTGVPPAHPAGFAGAIMVEEYRASAKVRAIMEQVAAVCNTEKVVIFSHYRRMLRILHRQLKDRAIGHLVLAGEVPVIERGEIVREFNERASKRVLLATILTGGEGLNLTVASVAILCEPWYNPAVDAQAGARIHRLGQLRPTKVIRFITKRTVEERIVEIHSEKSALLDFIDGGNDAQATPSLTNQQMSILFH